METAKKRNSGLKSIYRIILFSSIILFLSFLLVIYFFLKSTTFVNFVEYVLENRIHRQVKIGSISLTEGRRIIIKDFSIKEREGNINFIIIPQLEIMIHPYQLLKGNISEITIKKPKILLTHKKVKESKAKKKKPSLPFFLKKISLNNGDITLQLKKDKSLHFKSTTLSMEETVQRKKAMFRGKAFNPEMDAKVSVEAELDLERFNIDRGHIDISLINLEALSSKNLVPFLSDIDIKGFISLRADIFSENGSFTNGIGWQSEISIHDFSIHTKTLEVNLKEKPLVVTSKGIYSSKSDLIGIEFLKAQVGRLKPWTLRGSINKAFSDTPDINLTLNAQEVSLKEFKELVYGTRVKWLHDIDIEGYGQINLSIKGNPKSPFIKGTLFLKGEKMSSRKIELKTFEISFPVEYMKNKYVLRDSIIKIENTYTGYPPKENGYQYRLNNTEIIIPYLVYIDSKLESEMIQLNSDELTIFNQEKKYYTDKGISLKGALEGNLNKRHLKLKDISINTQFFKGIIGYISFNLGKPAIAEAAIEYRNMNLEKVWSKFLKQFFKKNEFNIKGNGSMQAALKVTIPERTSPQVSGRAKLNLIDGGFSSSDASMIGEGIKMDVTNIFAFSLPIRLVDFTIQGKASNFELLMGRFYGNFKDKSINISLKSKYSLDNDSLNISRSELSLTDIGSISFAGKIANLSEVPSFVTDITLTHLSNREFYKLFLQETFQESLPSLSKLEIDGSTSMNISAKGTIQRFNVRGHMKIDEINLKDNGSDLSIIGMNLSLPINVSYPDSFPSEEKKQFGSLKVHSLSMGAVQLKDLEVFPSIWQNTILFQEDITVPIFGGDVTFENISYYDILNPKRKLQLSINLEGIDLTEVSETLGIPRFKGNLSGTMPRVSFIGNSLLTEGDIILKLFGGEVRTSDLSIRNIFSPIPSLRCNIKLKDIDLGKLTKTFYFGHISGVLHGNISNLVIVNGQAESFKTSIKTVKKKNVTQRISVKALKKITIIGTGASHSILDKGIYQFFKDYKYEKMGFRALLKNDNLRLWGIETKGGKEYLVKGGFFPPKVDVINYTRNVSFKEMISRLKRIKQIEKKKKIEIK